MYDEVIIKIDIADIVENIKNREPKFDKETAELFICCYVENIDDVRHDYPYSVFLNNTSIESKQNINKELTERGFKNWNEYNKYRKEHGDEITYEKITKGKNKGKYLRIEGLNS